MKYQKHLIMLALLLAACHPSDQVQEQEEAKVTNAQQLVHLQPDQLEQANIRVANIQKQLLGEKIRVNGLFDVPPQNRAQASSLTDAFIKKTSLLVGDQVFKGQVLASLEHPDLITLQNDLIEKKQQLEYLKSEYDRQLELDKNRINAKKNLIKAKTSFLGMQAHVNALKAKIKMLGLNPDQVISGKIYDQVTLRSPINGYITQVHASLGAMVKLGEPIFEIIDPDHLHVELKVFEKDIHRIKINEPFTFSMTGDTSRYTGTIYLVGKQLNEDRTIDVHGHPDQKRPYFLPGMYVEANIYTNLDSVKVLPEMAVFEREGGHSVFIKKNALDYEVREIIIGKQTDGWVEIVDSDLNPEDEVVVEGVYFLSSLI